MRLGLRSRGARTPPPAREPPRSVLRHVVRPRVGGGGGRRRASRQPRTRQPGSRASTSRRRAARGSGAGAERAPPLPVAAPPEASEQAVRFAQASGPAVVHDFAYGDLVFDGRRPSSFLATPGAKDVGVEMFSMSKTYGMAGWRLGFVVGNAELVERINLLSDHARVGIFRPIQEAGIAALTGSQDSVAERAAPYERRRDRVLEVVDAVSEGTFYVWF